MTSPDPHDLPALLARLIRSMGAVKEGQMRAALLGEFFEARTPAQGCWLLSQCLRGALRGRAPHDDAMLAATLWLTRMLRDGRHDLFKSYYLAAHDEHAEELLYLFRQPPPQRALGPGARLPRVRLPLGREVTLGERRAMAAGADRRMLERLIMETTPLVISKLLGNPHIQERDVVQIASRRPTLPQLLWEVAVHPKWMALPKVRESLALNPYCPTGISLKLMPTLEWATLQRIRYSEDLHPMMPEFAGLLLKLHAHSSERTVRHAPLPD